MEACLGGCCSDVISRNQMCMYQRNPIDAALLTRLVERREVYLSNAVVNVAFLLRACVVNFRTTGTDMDALPDIVVQLGT